MFKNKVVIVTGSSKGIGAGTAVRFASEGAHVVIHGRNETALEEVKQKCLKASKNVKVHIVSGDISKEEIRQKLIYETVQVFGKIDVLVNNAAEFIQGNFDQSSMEVYDRLMDVNARSLIALTKLATPHLIESKGNIVNNSSAAGVKPVLWGVFYAIAKSAVNHFTKCLALELGPKGVRVNAVTPGFIPGTDVLSRIGLTDDDVNVRRFMQAMNYHATNSPGQQTTKSYIKFACEVYPLRRPGTVDEVANCILFLASEKASFVTGTLLPVDGGFV